MSLTLTGEIVLVTGASRGIGAAIADLLAARGATVIGTATTESGAAAIGERLAANGGAGRLLDVADGAAVEALIEAIGAEFGPISILVNNAGITRDNLLMRMKEEDWQAILDTNLTSVFRTSKAVMRGMMKARKGRIISIASVIGLTGNAGQANYAAAKAGIYGFTRTAAIELQKHRITVNALAPIAKTRMTEDLPMMQSVENMTPDHIAPAALFLASPLASYVNGEALTVDGGGERPPFLGIVAAHSK